MEEIGNVADLKEGHIRSSEVRKLQMQLLLFSVLH